MTNYRDAGVDIDAKMNAIQQMGSHVKATHSAAVLAGLGAFGGCFDLSAINATHAQPVLVASTDGIGTKTMVAEKIGHYAGLGADLVHHCINDILCQGATPLFFMDYIAAAKLSPELIVGLVQSMAAACQTNGVALLGGETAEMPGIYQAGACDVAGTIVGVVDRGQLIDGTAIQAGDVVLALPSSGLHTNGYSLARRICEPFGYDASPAGFEGTTLGMALLEPHRCYLRDIQALRAAGVSINGLVHITGGGIWDNTPRVVPAQFATELIRGSWDVPPICRFLVEQASIDEHEAHHVFNMGLGMLVIVPAQFAATAHSVLGDIRTVGRIVAESAAKTGQVRLVDA